LYINVFNSKEEILGKLLLYVFQSYEMNMPVKPRIFFIFLKKKKKPQLNIKQVEIKKWSSL
jgi:hypothetical protein